MGRTKKNKKLQKRKKEAPAAKTEQSSFFSRNWHMIVLFMLAFFLYANTLNHDYAQDDAIVIYDNMFTQKGIAGIPGILKNDTFYGFFKEEGKAKLVSGGRYRPFTLVMFALEWQLFGKSPFIGHLVNIILYGLLGLIIFNCLALLFGVKPHKKDKVFWLIWITAALYIVHPIHTEAVANIKGRDEIMSMLGSMMAFWFLLKHLSNKKMKYFAAAGISYFIALLSKENAITFLGIIPLAFMIIRKQSFSSSIMNCWILFASALAFLVLRFSVLGMDFGGTPNELMNNPFLKLAGNSYVDFSLHEKMATITFTLGKYIQLMLFPHPLSHDYYPRAIDIMYFSDWRVILSLAIYVSMIAGVFIAWKKDRYVAWGLAFYLLSLSIVSNIVFPIGTNMSERFLFMPSLGLLLVIARLMTQYIPQSLLLGITAALILLLSAKTITRNTVWKNDFTLFTTDVQKNTKSAKLLNAAGGALTNEASKMADTAERTEYLQKAISYLEQAIDIHPTYRNAYLLLGNAHYYMANYERSIQYFDQSLKLDANFEDALKNLPIVLRDGGRYMGRQEQNYRKAEEWLLRSYQLNPQDYETCRLLGITYGIQGLDSKAIEYFEKAIALRPDIAANYTSLGTAYINTGNKEKAKEAFDKAVELDPNALQHLNK